jgi:hypothetical protein
VAKKIDEQLDRLYQLPLEEFTAARNALAKEAGSESGAVKRLTKPPLPAWAVNQLYWSRRDDYDRLMDAALEMRKTHKSVIEGGRGDLRAAGREHELALDKALKATVALLTERGQTVTEGTRQAILNTLRALPADDEAPGRLSRGLTPGGFEMLAGIKTGAPRARKTEAAKTPASPRSEPSSRTKDRDAQRAADARRAREAAERVVRDAEHRARHAEFEMARTARDSAKAQKRLEDAQAALEDARTEAAAAERAAREAERAKEAAERKARDADAALAAAKRELARGS